MWFYESNGQPAGPVSEAELDRLRRQGQITPDNRVWKEGWPDWKLSGEVWPDQRSSTPPSLPSGHETPAFGRCAECGKLVGELVTIGQQQVCLQCKPVAFSKIREGMQIGLGPWREGNVLVMRKECTLPDDCIKCGQPSVVRITRTLSWHTPALYLLIFVGILIYALVALIVRNTAKVALPLCATCEATRKKHNLIAWGLFALGAALIGCGTAFVDAKVDTAVGFFITGGLIIFGDLFFIALTPLVSPKHVSKTHAWIKKVKEPFLAKLPPWPGA